ncbi:MAG: Hsp20/alpha crystallin family protein [Burkholderiaceae bacterium]|nr:Hsp20/alpha crystallin family protein [Burkholderiaceae bacterium]
MYRSLFPGDLFADFDRLQRVAERLSGSAGSLRGYERGGFPQINVGGTQEAIDVVAFAPGLDPAKIEVNVERGVLTLSGERASDLPTDLKQTSLHQHERFTGKFSRAISLPDDVDPERITAKYTDGLLLIKIQRKQAVQPRRVAIQ